MYFFHVIMIAISSHLGLLSCSIIRPSTTIHNTSLGLTDTFGPQLFFFFFAQSHAPFNLLPHIIVVILILTYSGPSPAGGAVCVSVCVCWRSASVFESRLWVAFCTFIRGTAGQMPLSALLCGEMGERSSLILAVLLAFFFSPLLIL
ncbi:hypothetical protein BO79DRAFT_47879 [Aspergillus costaricaensis CBS 115574]|uniref:Uncharacterized protein n=1 Tax=Aspergillus costaricaensis CBS 115574 TaxID=1448317 RepID=A0ACD1I4E5_9EURO|nr:hypothetical protein BO79DRAFT_47879 [Aspergillus costaricaensis CBS 115574]RAK85438.1 hypothetical protein BO79DRAFT_47879 [Aspergillus costaricaensis CBS 115574]